MCQKEHIRSVAYSTLRFLRASVIWKICKSAKRRVVGGVKNDLRNKARRLLGDHEEYAG